MHKLECAREIIAQRTQDMLVMVHTVEGSYQLFNEDAHRAAGIDVKSFVGRRWQEFSLSPQVDKEASQVTGVVATGRSTIVRVARKWPGKSVRLVGKLSLIQSTGGTKLILRQGRIVTKLQDMIDLAVNAIHVSDESSDIDFILDQLRFLSGLSARNTNLPLLHELLCLARDAAAIEVRKHINQM